MVETLAHHRYYGIPIADAMPRTFVAVDVELHYILDFRDGRIRQRLQVSEKRILTVDWRKESRAGHQPITQTIGLAAFEVGWEGLVVPSAADPSGQNLLIFPDKLQSGSHIGIQNAAQLA